MRDRNSQYILWLLAFLLIGSQSTITIGKEPDSESLPSISESRSVSIKAGEETDPIVIERRQPLTLVFDRRISEVDSFDPDFITVHAISPQKLKIFDKRKTGDMHLWVTDEYQVRTKVNVRIVSESLRHLESYLDELFPESELILYQLNGSLLIRGNVPDQSQLVQIDEVAREFFPNVLMRATLRGALPQHELGQIPTGMRVVSVQVDDAQTGLGTLAQGDRVDVLVTYQLSNSHGLTTKTKFLLENTPVFTVSGQPTSDRKRSVSLIVTPEQASFVQLAKQKGELSLVWRNRANDEQTQAGLIDEQLLAELQGTADSSLSALPPIRTPNGVADDVAPSPSEIDLQTEIRALHTDVKRLIELLENRQSASDTGIPQRNEQSVGANEPQKPVDLKVLFFHSQWAARSQQLLAVVDRIAAEESVEVTKIDIDQQRELADKYSIESLPTLLLLDGNKQVKRLMGNLVNETTAEELIQQISHPEYYDLWQSIGIRLKPITVEEISDVEGLIQGGMKVIQIDRNFLAGRGSPLRVDDILVGLGTRQTSSIADVQQALLSDSRIHKLSFPATGRKEESLMVMYYAIREDQELNGYLQIDQKPSNDLRSEPVFVPPTRK